MKRLTRISLTSLLALALTALPRGAFACAVCFGDPESPLVEGAMAGVLVLAAFIYTVLFTMAGVAFYWFRRAKALARAEAGEPETA